MKRAKQLAIILSAIIIAGAVASWFWRARCKEAVTFVTLTTSRHEILGLLNTINAIDRKEAAQLREEAERDLAWSTISLMQVLKETHSDSTEIESVLRALRRYTFQITNETTLTVTKLLQDQK